MKNTKNFREKVRSTLFAIFVLTIIIMPFRIYSSLYGIASSTSPKVERDLVVPFNQTLLRTTSHINLERNIQKGISIDLGSLLTGELKSWDVLNIPDGSSVLIAYDNEPIKLRFNFGQFETLGGHWRSEEVRFITSGGMDQTLMGEPGRTEKKWGGVFGVSSSLKKVSPNFSVVVPVNKIDINGDISDRQFSILVEMDIEYPITAGTSVYDDHQGTLTHSFSLMVLTPDELAEYQAVKKVYFFRQLFMVFLIWFAILFIEYILVFYERIYKKMAVVYSKYVRKNHNAS